MLEKTKAKYYKNARGFLNRHFDGRIPNECEILYLLHQKAKHYTPKSFTNLKCYLAFFFEQQMEFSTAIAVRNFKNPVAELGYYHKPPRKIKTLSDNDMQKIIDAVTNKKDVRTSKAKMRRAQLHAAVRLAKYLGCRHGEMPMIRRTGETTFFIEGIKKDEFGGKGLDRYIKVDDKNLADILEKSCGYLKNANMSHVIDSFRYLMKKVFRQRKKLPTLYVFLHIMGANLKASDFSREEMAYIVGHQSTRSIENYGYRAGKVGGLKVKPAIDLDEIHKLVRDNHSERKQEMENRLELRDNLIQIQTP